MSEIINKKLKKLVAELREPYPHQVKDLFDRIDQGVTKLNFINFIGPEDPLEMGAPQFEFHFLNQGAPNEWILPCPWMATLEEELFKRRLKVQTPEQEAYRNGTRLLSNLKWADIQFGKGYTSQVLWKYLDERFGNIPQIKEILSNVAHYKAYESPHALECQSYIKSVIDGTGNSLVMNLGYDNKKAFSILVGSIIYMLDKRHNITIGKLLFPNRR